jgi:hypothetical protein
MYYFCSERKIFTIEDKNMIVNEDKAFAVSYATTQGTNSNIQPGLG